MLRFVIGPEAWVVPDVDAKLPGRGFWLSARRDMIETAAARKAFAKAARQAVFVPDNLADRVDDLLVRRVLDRIGLTKRTGDLVYGYEKVVTTLKFGQVAFLIEACDAASGGREKIRSLGKGLPVVDLFERAELGTAVGREEVVHIAIKRGRMAEVLWWEADRLARYRGLTGCGNEPAPRLKGKARVI